MLKSSSSTSALNTSRLCPTDTFDTLHESSEGLSSKPIPNLGKTPAQANICPSTKKAELLKCLALITRDGRSKKLFHTMETLLHACTKQLLCTDACTHSTSQWITILPFTFTQWWQWRHYIVFQLLTQDSYWDISIIVLIYPHTCTQILAHTHMYTQHLRLWYSLDMLSPKLEERFYCPFGQSHTRTCHLGPGHAAPVHSQRNCQRRHDSSTLSGMWGHRQPSDPAVSCWPVWTWNLWKYLLWLSARAHTLMPCFTGFCNMYSFKVEWPVKFIIVSSTATSWCGS